MATIDYYFFSASPFTYFGHGALLDVAQKHGAAIAFKPVDLFSLWDVSGAVPPAKRPPVRQRYRLLELQRCAEYRGLPINTKPKHWPVDASLADRSIIALLHHQEDPSDYIADVLAACWAEEKDIADEATLRRLLEKNGFTAEAIMESARQEATAEKRAQNTQEAIEADAVGVPAYVLNGEVFWGQDRIEYLDRALEQGRAAFTA